MVASVRSRTLLVLPRRAWRTFRSRSKPVEEREPRAPRPSLMKSFEQMLDHQVQLMIREFDD